MIHEHEGLLPVTESAVFGVVGETSVLRYVSSVATEYEAIRRGCALLDLSCISLIRIEGQGAEQFLQRLCARDVAFLFSERSRMTLLLDEEGHVVDIVTVYRSADGFVLESSFGQGRATYQHVRDAAPTDVEVVIDASQVAFGMEGPAAPSLVDAMIGPEVAELPYQGVLDVVVDGTPVRVSRTGFSGEYGYKVHAPTSQAEILFSRFAEVATPVGMSALEVSMIEIRQPVLHLELVGTRDPFRCGYQWLTNPEKSSFLGQPALLRSIDSCDEGTVSITCEDPGLAVNDLLAVGDEVVGSVVVAVEHPVLPMTVGLARISKEWRVANLTLTTPNGVRVVTTSNPIVVPTSWGRAAAQRSAESR